MINAEKTPNQSFKNTKPASVGSGTKMSAITNSGHQNPAEREDAGGTTSSPEN
jgi:hypothetical protein